MIPIDLPGLDPAWSRLIEATDETGVVRSWHVLDNGPQLAERGITVIGTVLCVHGNPTWSYLWRRVLQQAPQGWRVVAVDHLGMGYSQRLDAARTLTQRVADLGDLTAALDVSGPVVPLAHDWGGPIALGWTLQHTADVAALVLTNTAVHHDDDQPKPVAITAIRSRPLLDLLTMRTPAFVAATTATVRPPLAKDVRRAFAAPYRSPQRRRAVRDFVADVPFEPDHRSHDALQQIADGVATLTMPALLVWGTRDPVFSQRYLLDLQQRLPHADVQAYPQASHLVLEDNPEGVEVIWSWITQQFSQTRSAATPPDSQQALVPLHVHHSNAEHTAIVELGPGGGQITRGQLAARVEALAGALYARGLRPGHRVAVLVPPGINLNTVAYAVWRLGGIVVVADAGLGLSRLGAALRSTSPDYVIGIRAALLLAQATRVPGVRISAAADAIATLIAEGSAGPAAADPGGDAQDREAAILFTSGATGPPKGVVYTRRQLQAQVTTLRDTFDLRDGEGFVAAFAPFALYGPPLGLPCAVPDMDVTAPHTLTAGALADAVTAVAATAVFASPAALRNVVATASDLSEEQRQALAGPRLVMSAGAPVPVDLLRQVKVLMPSAQTQTPYGMTEVLPVATIDPTTTDRSDASEGVCVGPPVPGVEVRIVPLDGALDAEPDHEPDLSTTAVTDSGTDELSQAPWVLGEIVVRAPHVKLRYHRAWAAQRASEQPQGWHRTGDVGHLDDLGRLWVHGRGVHLMHTPSGPVAPYPVEHRIATVPGVHDVAVVGVGPRGTAACVAIIVPPSTVRRRDSPLAGARLAADVRAAAGVPIAAVLVKDWLPVDIRHASKVDRTGLSVWASQVLHGRAKHGLSGALGNLIGPRTRQQPTTRSR